MKINPKIRRDTWATDLKGADFFAVIRIGEDPENVNAEKNYEFFLLHEVGVDQAEAEENRKRTQRETPYWDRDNPVKEIIPIKLIATRLSS
jgi:hypothetical protein